MRHVYPVFWRKPTNDSNMEVSALFVFENENQASIWVRAKHDQIRLWVAALSQSRANALKENPAFFTFLSSSHFRKATPEVREAFWAEMNNQHESIARWKNNFLALHPFPLRQFKVEAWELFDYLGEEGIIEHDWQLFVGSGVEVLTPQEAG